MVPIYTDLHIHTSANPDKINDDYDLDLLVKNILVFNQNSEFLISITDHNVVNKTVYLKAAQKKLNIILGVELHIKNYPQCPAYHCHIYFDLAKIDENVIDDINAKLLILYPKKVVEKNDPKIPSIQEIVNAFDAYEFMLLPHGGQSHATFDTSIPKGVKFDTTLERSIYYNQFDGFTARGIEKLETTQDYFRRLGINEFVNLITCSDNYTPGTYPAGKDAHKYIPTWILAQPNFNGLRLSLSEKSRLIYSNLKPELWSEHIKSVQLHQPNIEIDVQLTSGLNVIIGGSSSGKTLLVDSISQKLDGDVMDTVYIKYGVDKIIVENPSGMKPHYLSQNYIMGVVNNIADDKIENIEIIKRVFPGDDELKEKINTGLRNFKSSIQELIKNVKTLQTEEKNLEVIPVLSRLINKKNVASNVFNGLIPTEQEIDLLNYPKGKHESYLQALLEIDGVLDRSPFIQHDPTLVKKLIEELQLALLNSNIERKIRDVISTDKHLYDLQLREKNSEEQTKKQHFEKLLESLRKYSRAYHDFNKALEKIFTYSFKSDSEEIESMGHKLFIENSFVLNKDKFIETVNTCLTKPITDEKNITPEFFFDKNFKKRPKVASYDDFENRIYSAFQTMNKKKYKIITSDGKDFDDLSPGWKTSIILDIILGYDKDISPVIIDQPEDNLATNYINEGLVSAIMKIKSKKQIILVSHNATIPMMADAQNIILCRNEGNKIVIKSSPLEGLIDGEYVVDHIAKITDGGKPSIKKRVKKYNLKKFNG